ncbi:recombinase family protein [Streptomyces griseorubiginosus]|uniref:recombinase family protein n=1 Tax=Streptomyces griseorubiginosus TaxID=67304 RepID=UPI001AD6F614|nr:recombinase family protein [Streptomyces griseorubiginosus]MBO4258524.1 recombinase family protein [Streptomyces griseorubiginosus]
MVLIVESGGAVIQHGGSETGGLIPVASYARTSEDSRQRDGHGVRYQLRINERTARDHGCVVVMAYSDNARSASKAGVVRPGFDRLMADLVRGRTDGGQPIKGVVCVADDRLYRRAEDLARFFAALTSSPGRIYVDPQGVRDPYSQEGLMQAVRSLDAAATETRVRSRRLSHWHWARAVEGVPHSGPRPFGWLEDRITLHPEESKLVEQAISDRLSGKAVRAIARDWCELGVTGTRGGRPNGQTVTQIITAPRVCGYRANRGELLFVPETGEPVVGQWQPISTPELWHAVCATFSPGSLFLHRGSGAPRLTDSRRPVPRHLGTGFLRCGARSPDGTACGGALCAQKGRSQRSPYVYSCRNCRRCSISGPLVDTALERLIFDQAHGCTRVPDTTRQRWQVGEMGLDEKRKIVGSFVTHCLVRPGVKADHTWDFSRVEPIWR